MARSGGTLFSRCLGSMDGVVLLSEIHPLGIRTFNPLVQASCWYKLISREDRSWVKSTRPGFAEVIGLIERRCSEQGKVLILRDWSHLDYTGVPFTLPTYKSKLAATLRDNFCLQRFSTIRHPMDQWLSLMSFPLFRSKLGAAAFIMGYVQFSGLVKETGFQKYEDLTHDPDRVMKQVCSGLDVEFDPAYSGRWKDYHNITGDNMPGGRGGQTIETLPRMQSDSSSQEKLIALTEYHQLLESLGYD